MAKCDKSKCLADNICVGNACVLTCKHQSDCLAETQRCVPATEDETNASVFVCRDTDLKENGKPCPQRTECTFPNLCRSNGVGDATAYCVSPCVDDSECPGGFECGTIRDPTPLCDTTKGNNNFCGTTSDACITRAILALDPRLVEGERCIYRKICVKRSRCAPCASDVDCLNVGARCMDVAGSKRCLDPCARDTDCEASDNCAIEAGSDGGFCAPRFGGCVSATPGFCSPCRYDVDCGAGLACTSLHGSERSCVDPKFSATCTTNNDCPVAPSGLHGTCLGPAQQISPGDALYHHCYVPEDANEAFTCYPAH
ncbi:MAG: hypothetical protein IPJ65_10415 [Archangiaceae bacterium]|nr:hypothetical protein [Archangiaceae bacterium]